MRVKLSPARHSVNDLRIFDLNANGEMVNARPLVESGNAHINIIPSVYTDAIKRGIPNGQALALALDQPVGTVVNGPVSVIDEILKLIHEIEKEDHERTQ